MTTADTTKQHSTTLRELEEIGAQEAHLSGCVGATTETIDLDDQFDAAFEVDDRARLQTFADRVQRAGGFPIVGDYDDSAERLKRKNAEKRQQHNRLYIDASNESDVEETQAARAVSSVTGSRKRKTEICDDDDDDDDVEVVADDDLQSGEINDANDFFSPEFRVCDPDSTNPSKMFSTVDDKRRRLMHPSQQTTKDTPLGTDVNAPGGVTPSKSKETAATEIASITPAEPEKIRRHTARLQSTRNELRSIRKNRTVRHSASPSVAAVEAIDRLIATADAKIEHELDKLAKMLTAMRDLENTRAQVQQFSTLLHDSAASKQNGTAAQK